MQISMCLVSTSTFPSKKKNASSHLFFHRASVINLTLHICAFEGSQTEKVLALRQEMSRFPTITGTLLGVPIKDSIVFGVYFG